MPSRERERERERDRERERGLEGVGGSQPRGVCIFGVWREGGEQAAEDGFALSAYAPRGVRRALPSAALVPANPAADEALTWGRPADSLHSLEALGAWARRGHSTPHNVP